VSLHKSCHHYIQLGNFAAQNCHHNIQDFLACVNVTFIYAICVLMYAALSLLVSDSPSPHAYFYPVNLQWYRPEGCMFLAVPVTLGLLGHYFRLHSIGNVWRTHVHGLYCSCSYWLHPWILHSNAFCMHTFFLGFIQFSDRTLVVSLNVWFFYGDEMCCLWEVNILMSMNFMLSNQFKR